VEKVSSAFAAKFGHYKMNIMNKLEFRKTPLEAFECRHCKANVRSADSVAIAAQLCKSCFDIRKQYRKDNPRKSDEKAELYWGEEPFGKKRGGKKFICIYCAEEYPVVPLTFHDRTESEVADARAFFDKMAPYRELSGKSDMKLKIEAFDYTNAPKGWTNELLCKACFDNPPQAYSFEIEQANQAVQIEQEERISREKAIQEEKKEKDSVVGITKSNPIGTIGLVIVLIACVLALFKFMTTGVAEGWNVASKESPVGKFIFFVILGIGYLVSIPWLREKGSGYRELSTFMSWIAGVAFAIFVISVIPSCDADRGSNSDQERPYYRK
jgi:hypothetical protein